MERRTERAAIRIDEALCPLCFKRLCRLREGARANGVELWCKFCRAPVVLDTGEKDGRTRRGTGAPRLAGGAGAQI